MKMTETFLAQLDREAVGTRKALERVPEGKNDWKPHQKSMQFGYLSSLVATMPYWITLMIEKDEFDIASGVGSPQPVETAAELIEAHDKALEGAKKALSGTTDEHLLTPWKLLYGGNLIDNRPRHLVIEDTICHLAHHRGQLTVYLRLNDQPVPAIYGDSADSRQE